MRLNGAVASVLYSSALLLSHVAAQEELDIEEVTESSSTEAVESSATSVIEKPTFTVSWTYLHTSSANIKMARRKAERN